MKWRVIVELTGRDGTVREHEVSAGGSTKIEHSPETIGLTLTEGKRTLAELQHHLVQAKAEDSCRERRRCSRCGPNGPSKIHLSAGCCRCSARWRFAHRNVSTTLIQPGSEFKVHCGALFRLCSGRPFGPSISPGIRGSAPPSCCKRLCCQFSSLPAACQRVTRCSARRFGSSSNNRRRRRWRRLSAVLTSSVVPHFAGDGRTGQSQRTGKWIGPRLAAVRYQTTARAGSGRRRGARTSTARNAIWLCSRVRWKPRQPCGPRPKLRICSGLRVMSKRAGPG
jgi:hypothetical protein